MSGLVSGVRNRWMRVVVLVGACTWGGFVSAQSTRPTSSSAAVQVASAGPSAGAQKPSAAIPKAGNGNPLDLNTATAEQLKALPGIGDAYAKRIIEGRPYTAKNQLVQRGVIPQATYDKVKDQIVARRPAK